MSKPKMTKCEVIGCQNDAAMMHLSEHHAGFFCMVHFLEIEDDCEKKEASREG